jgi:hypothetical protein
MVRNALVLLQFISTLQSPYNGVVVGTAEPYTNTKRFLLKNEFSGIVVGKPTARLFDTDQVSGIALLQSRSGSG